MSEEKRKPGRPPGAVSRNLLAVRAAANQLNYNLVAEYIKTIAHIDDPVEKMKAQQFLFKYMYPAFKEVELSREVMEEMLTADAIDIPHKAIETGDLLEELEDEEDE